MLLYLMLLIECSFEKQLTTLGGGGTIYFAVDGTSYHSGYLCNEEKRFV